MTEMERKAYIVPAMLTVFTAAAAVMNSASLPVKEGEDKVDKPEDVYSRRRRRNQWDDEDDENEF